MGMFSDLQTVKDTPNPLLSPTSDVSPKKNNQPQKLKKSTVGEGSGQNASLNVPASKSVSDYTLTGASKPDSKLDSKIDSYIADLIADTATIFKDQKVKGASYAEVSYVRLTTEEKIAIRNMVTQYNNKQIKITENDLVRILTTFMLSDHQARKHDSLIARLIASIYK